MSGIEVIGLISAIIGIIDGASKVYNAIQDSRQLPEAFARVAGHLPLARDTLQTIKARVEPESIDQSRWLAIKPTLQSCSDKAERLRSILDEVAAQPDASKLQRYRLAIYRLGKESKLEVLAKQMLEDVQLLAANQAVKSVSEEKIEELTKAIKDLSQVPDSVPGGPSFTNQGDGDQVNNAGSGAIYMNKGRGQQYNAQSMSFGSS